MNNCIPFGRACFWRFIDGPRSWKKAYPTRELCGLVRMGVHQGDDKIGDVVDPKEIETKLIG